MSAERSVAFHKAMWGSKVASRWRRRKNVVRPIGCCVLSTRSKEETMSIGAAAALAFMIDLFLPVRRQDLTKPTSENVASFQAKWERLLGRI
jgi:hypothetical protein